MCVGMSARVVKVDRNTALVDADGARLSVSANLVENLLPGDYVMVHPGSAIGKITADDEDETDGILEGLL